MRQTFNWCYKENRDHDYEVFLPDGYNVDDSGKDWPLIVFLHGGGQPADVSAMVKPLRDLPAIVLCPICPLPVGDPMQQDWHPQLLGHLIKKVITDYRIDTSRVTLTGFSMGGSAALALPYHHPELFCKTAVISGSAQAWIMGHYPNIPVRIYSGDQEPYFSAHGHSVEIGKQFNVNISHTIWEGLDHGQCFQQTINDKDYLNWLLSDKDRMK